MSTAVEQTAHYCNKYAVFCTGANERGECNTTVCWNSQWLHELLCSEDERQRKWLHELLRSKDGRRYRMTDTKRERVAKELLSAFREIWCDRESDEEPFFNCSKCEFEMDDGRCVLKLFLKSEKFKDEFPEGAIGGDDK